MDFKFYDNFFDAINLLPEGKREKACYEFCKYGITGKLPEDKNLAMFCLGVSVSVQKYQGRGGNHNPKGNNQYSLGQRGQRGQSGLKGQSGLNEQTETKTKTKTKTETKEKEIQEKEILKNFNEFYLMYPLKRSKEKALQAYKKAILAAEPSAIMDGLKKYIDDIRIKRTEPKFIKHPSTWLNQGCWQDEYDSCVDYSDPRYHNSRL